MATKQVFHFDINGTIILVDTTEPGNDIENANMVIAKSIYGKVINNIWTMNDDYLDETNSISYYNYLRQSGQDHKSKSYVTTQKNEPGEKLSYLIPSLIQSIESFVFPSFLNVLNKYPHVLIVFRTFGLDADEVIDHLKSKYESNFKTIIKGEFSYENDEIILKLEDGTCLRGMQNINGYFKETNNHCALKESYNYWNKNSKSKLCGKQLCGDSDMKQLFFDDNDCVNVMDSTNCSFIKINTLGALLDEDYYINLINQFM